MSHCWREDGALSIATTASIYLSYPLQNREQADQKARRHSVRKQSALVRTTLINGRRASSVIRAVARNSTVAGAESGASIVRAARASAVSARRAIGAGSTVASATSSAVNDSNATIKLDIDGALGLDVGSENLILGIERDSILEDLVEEVVAAASDEVERDDVVLLFAVQRLVADGDAHQPAAVVVLGVVFDFDAAADLEEAGDFFAVELAYAGDDAFEHFPDVVAGHGDFDERVAEGERAEDVAAGDVAFFDGGADAAGVDDGEVGAVAVVEAVLEHGVGHEVAEEAWEVALALACQDVERATLTLLLLAGGLVQLDISSANDLSGELFEGASPLVDLSLQSGVLLGFVGDVDGTAVVLQNLAFGIVCDIDVACCSLAAILSNLYK